MLRLRAQRAPGIGQKVEKTVSVVAFAVWQKAHRTFGAAVASSAQDGA